jgi:hypothetical protein
MSSGAADLAEVTDDVVYLPVESDYTLLWQRTQLAMAHVWKHYKGKFDFVLKADDDTSNSWTGSTPARTSSSGTHSALPSWACT